MSVLRDPPNSTKCQVNLYKAKLDVTPLMSKYIMGDYDIRASYLYLGCVVCALGRAHEHEPRFAPRNTVRAILGSMSYYNQLKGRQRRL